MSDRIEKTSQRVKDQMEFWFLSGKDKTDFNGTELFTLFDLIPESDKRKLIEKMELKKNEIPVLILKISESEFIINSTHKFILLDHSKTEFIEYADFEGHNGFKPSTIAREDRINVKQNGHAASFGIRKTNGELITRKIPTGEPGFAFWNVTKKCELIGRKYTVTE